MSEMTPLAEPNEYVNLAPTTGPVPLMVPADELRARRDRERQAAAAEIDAADEAMAAAAADAALVDVEAPTVDEIVDDVAAETQLDTDDEPEPVDTLDEIDEIDEMDDDRAIAPVVSLFGGDTGPVPAAVVEPEPVVAAAPAKGSVDDLFAKLRAARTVAVVAAGSAVADEPTGIDEPTIDAEPTTALEPTIDDEPVVDATEELSVFQPSPVAPATAVEYDDSSFGRRDAELTPLIVTGARKLKRVLADEQNDVLHALRGAKSVRSLDDLLPAAVDHVHRYAGAIHDELLAAAVAGAASVDDAGVKDHTKAVNKSDALKSAEQSLGTAIVQPLRDRLERAVAEAEGDSDDLTSTVRAVYREWKTQRIDEHLDDVARMAFGRGALVALAPGTPICWLVDPNGPDCPDAEDNSLAGVVNAGDPFPTDHLCAPAHEGCRCMLQRVPR
jgi:hypothetical protein